MENTFQATREMISKFRDIVKEIPFSSYFRKKYTCNVMTRNYVDYT